MTNNAVGATRTSNFLIKCGPDRRCKHTSPSCGVNGFAKTSQNTSPGLWCKLPRKDVTEHISEVSMHVNDRVRLDGRGSLRSGLFYQPGHRQLP